MVARRPNRGNRNLGWRRGTRTRRTPALVDQMRSSINGCAAENLPLLNTAEIERARAKVEQAEKGPAAVGLRSAAPAGAAAAWCSVLLLAKHSASASFAGVTAAGEHPCIGSGRSAHLSREHKGNFQGQCWLAPRFRQ